MRAILTILVFSFFLSLGSVTAGETVKPGRRLGKGTASYLPVPGEAPGLELTKKAAIYRGDKFNEYYGASGARYMQYGLSDIATAEYTLGGEGKTMTAEAARMKSQTAAAGMFHYYRGQFLAGRGTAVQVGSEGVVDSVRKNRSLYFYKGSVFCKVVYSGPEPVPDLVPVGLAMAAMIKGESNIRADGFAYLDVPGVEMDTVGLTPGFTFNSLFLPPSVCARAPGAGAEVSDIYMITTQKAGTAQKVGKDYETYLRLNGDNYEVYKRGKQRFCKAVDPGQGRVVFTVYKNSVIIVARPQEYEKGEALIEQVLRRMDGGSRM